MHGPTINRGYCYLQALPDAVLSKALSLCTQIVSAQGKLDRQLRNRITAAVADKSPGACDTETLFADVEHRNVQRSTSASLLIQQSYWKLHLSCSNSSCVHFPSYYPPSLGCRLLPMTLSRLSTLPKHVLHLSGPCRERCDVWKQSLARLF